MTSNMKCLFCETELEQMHDKKLLGCPKCLHIADGAFWVKEIQTKDILKFLKEEIDRSATALIERTKELDACQKDLEIARKALEDITKEHCAFADWVFKAVTMTGIAEKALEKIEHKGKK